MITFLSSSLSVMLLGMTPMFVSCSSPAFKAKPPQPTGFLSGPPDLQDQRGKGPFALSAGNLESSLTRIYIAPVILAYQCESVEVGAPLQIPPAEQREIATQLAPALEQEFVAAFAQSPSPRYRISRQPGTDCLILKLALTEVRTSGVRQGLTRLAISGIGLPEGILPASTRKLKPSIAIEGKLIDPTSGVTIYKFADREESPHAILPVRDLLSSESHARTTIRRWAIQFEELTRPDAPKNRDSSAFGFF
jgi:hypothetical protein